MLATAAMLALAGAAPAPAARPNLAVTQVSKPPSSVGQAGTFTVKDTVRASGRPKASLVAYYLSANARRDTRDYLLTGVRRADRGKAKGSAKVVVPAFVPAGSYRLIACADVNGALREGSEKDNCRVAAGKVRVKALRRQGPLDAQIALDTERQVVGAFIPGQGVADSTGSESTGFAEHLTATAADGTRYTLRIPKDALLSPTRIALTPIASVAGIPGAATARGVQIDPPNTALLTAATLEVAPPRPFDPTRVIPLAYDGANGKDVHLAPLVGSPRSVVFGLSELGGFMTVVGGPRAGALRAAQSGVVASNFVKMTPSQTRHQIDHRVGELIGHDRLGQLLGVDEDATGGDAVRDALTSTMEGWMRTFLVDAEASLTFVDFARAMRARMSIDRRLSFMGDGGEPVRFDEGLDARLQALVPRVLERLHGCRQGVADAAGIMVIRRLRLQTEGLTYEVPPDTGSGCETLVLEARTSYYQHGGLYPDHHEGIDAEADVRIHVDSLSAAVSDTGRWLNARFYTDDGCYDEAGPPRPENPWRVRDGYLTTQPYYDTGSIGSLDFGARIEPGTALMAIEAEAGDPCYQNPYGDYRFQLARPGGRLNPFTGFAYTAQNSLTATFISGEVTESFGEVHHYTVRAE